MNPTISKYIGTILVGLVLAGIGSSITLYSQVKTQEVRIDTLEEKVVDKEIVELRVKNIEEDILELKEHIKEIKETQIESEVKAAKRDAKIDLILEKLK